MFYSDCREFGLYEETDSSLVQWKEEVWGLWWHKEFTRWLPDWKAPDTTAHSLVENLDDPKKSALVWLAGAFKLMESRIDIPPRMYDFKDEYAIAKLSNSIYHRSVKHPFAIEPPTIKFDENKCRAVDILTETAALARTLAHANLYITYPSS